MKFHVITGETILGIPKSLVDLFQHWKLELMGGVELQQCPNAWNFALPNDTTVRIKDVDDVTEIIMHIVVYGCLWHIFMANYGTC